MLFLLRRLFMNEVIEKNKTKVENLIYEIRGKQVMLDSDLAKLYECKNGTKTINLAVKRNINRFPNNFYFQLTEFEYNSLRFQSETLKSGSGKHIKYLPYVFTEEGVAMLSSILRTPKAVEVSVNIMNAFVMMRKFISENKDTYKEITIIRNNLLDHDDNINELFDKFE